MSGPVRYSIDIKFQIFHTTKNVRIFYVLILDAYIELSSNIDG